MEFVFCFSGFFALVLEPDSTEKRVQYTRAPLLTSKMVAHFDKMRLSLLEDADESAHIGPQKKSKKSIRDDED